MQNSKGKKQKKGYTLNQNGEYEGVVYYYRLKPGYDNEMTGWCYIGETTREKARRSCFNCDSYNYGGKKFNEARKTFGKDAFDYWSDKQWDKDLEQLKAKLEESERKLIKMKDSIAHGFNTNTGGRGLSGMTLSQEQRELRRKNRTGCQHTEEAKKKISEANKGRVKSATTKQKMKAAAKKRWANRNNPN